MKFKYLLVVIVLIIIAHVAIILICFKGDSSGKPAPEKTVEKKEVQPGSSLNDKSPASAVPSKADKYRQLAAAQKTEAQPVKNKLTVIHKTYPALNYRNAWQGNIREIPESANIRSGILVDADTGTVLWAKNAQQSYPIASMTKMMTLVLAFEDIYSGRNGVSLDSPVKVTYMAQKMGGSQVWLDTTETFRLEELLKAVSIKSANDAAYLVAEFLGGNDVATFIERMNTRAKELGMSRTRFYNPHGLPEKPSSRDNVSTPEDMVRLAEKTLCYPKLMEWASTVQTDFRAPGTRGHLSIVNHNNLLPGRRYPAIGVDGLKTGYIDRAGFCVTVTCLRGGHRLIAVVMGCKKAENRDLFARKLLDWGYARRANPAEANARSQKVTVRTPARKKAAPVKSKAKAKTKVQSQKRKR